MSTLQFTKRSKVLLCLLLFVFVLTSVALFMTGWATVMHKGEVTWYGLWQICKDGCESTVITTATPMWYRVVQGLVTIGWISLLMTVIGVLTHGCLPQLKLKYRYITLAACIMNTLFIAAGTTVWGIKMTDETASRGSLQLQYCFVFCVLTSMTSAVISGLIYQETQSSPSDAKQYKLLHM